MTGVADEVVREAAGEPFERARDGAVKGIGWFGVIRLGLVQTSLGAIVVLTTSTINRVMVVELSLPALLPGLLVGLHYAVQITRPRLGHGSDQGGRRTPWIIGGMLVLGIGGVLAAVATAVLANHTLGGTLLAIVAFVLVGIGVGASGTSLLVLLAQRVTPRYRGAAATTVWVMMIAGFIVTAIVAGAYLDPFSFERLIAVTATVSLIALTITLFAVSGIEPRVVTARHREGGLRESRHAVTAEPVEATPFRLALREVWEEPDSRRFSIFVFVSMLAYSAQDLILEPFAGAVFGMTPGESTQLSGAQHGGVLLGMLCVAFGCSVIGGKRLGSLRSWTIGGCLASAVALVVLSVGGFFSAVFPLRIAVFALGMANGAFAVAAIGSMMDLVGRGNRQREGVRMGLWGAAQAIAFGLGGVFATFAVDVSQWLTSSPRIAYAIVFVLQGVLFLGAARLALRVYQPASPERQGSFSPGRMALEVNR